MNATRTYGSVFDVPSERSDSPAPVPSHIEYDSDDMISVPESDVPTEHDAERPHNRNDDSNLEVSGSNQTSLQALCTLQSVAWATRVVTFENGHQPDQILLLVSN